MGLQKGTNCTVKSAQAPPINTKAVKTRGRTTWIKYEAQRSLATHFFWFRSFRKWHLIHSEHESKNHYSKDFKKWRLIQTKVPDAPYTLLDVTPTVSARRGWEDGYSTAKWWISLVPSSFHPNIGFLLSLFRNKDIKDPKIGC